MANKFTTTVRNIKNANHLATENQQLKLDNERSIKQRNIAAGAAGGIAAVALGATAMIKRSYTKKLAAEKEERLRAECESANNYLKACKAACHLDKLSIKMGISSESDKEVIDDKAEYKRAIAAFKKATTKYAAYTGHAYVEVEDEVSEPEPVPEKKSFLKKLNHFKKKSPAPTPTPSEDDTTETVETTESTEATTETTETSATETVEATSEATTETSETSTTETVEKEVK